MTNLKKLLTLLFLALSLGGCAPMARIGFNDGRIPHAVLGTYDNQVIRMGVSRGDRAHAIAPQVYPMRLHHHWTDRAARYRWVAVFFREPGLMGNALYFDALVPDTISTLEDGDVVDVVTNVTNQADYDKLDMPFVLAKVCSGKDKDCLKALKNKDGWGYGPLRPATGTERQVVHFSPRFDHRGHLLR